MGHSLSRIMSLVKTKKPYRILMVGLDGAGKTTILNRLRLGDILTTIHPDTGFIVQTVKNKDLSFTVWDVGKRDENLRPLWRQYYPNTSAIIFVFDSNDPQRLEEAKEGLEVVLEREEVQGCPLLVMANKMDLPQAVSVDQLTDTLKLHQMARPWFVQPTCAISSQGVYEALDWLTAQLT